MKTLVGKPTTSEEADEALNRMVARVNDGFSGGKASRHSLLSWILIRFESNSFDSCLPQIRADHFDELMHLEELLQKAKAARRSGASQEAVSEILRQRTILQDRKPEIRRPKPKQESLLERIETVKSETAKTE